MRHSILPLLVVLSVAGCGLDTADTQRSSLAGPGIDAGPGPDAIDPAFDLFTTFTSPDEFDRADCTPGALAGQPLEGIWHVGNGISAFALRIERDANGPLVFWQGREKFDFQLTNDYLLVRNYTDYGFDGLQAVRGLLICRKDDSNHLFARRAWCDNFNAVFSPPSPLFCTEETVPVTRVTRTPGEGVAEGLELVGEWSGNSWNAGFTLNVRVHNNLAYVVRSGDGLRVVNVADPTNMDDVGFHPMPNDRVNDVKIVENPDGSPVALVASGVRGVVAIDMTDPSAPFEIARFPPTSGNICVHTLFTETLGAQTRAYFSDCDETFYVVDVTDPTRWVQLGTHVQAPGRLVHDLFVENGRAYLNYPTIGLVILDTQDPRNMVEIGIVPDTSYNHSNWVTTIDGCKVAVMAAEGYGAIPTVVGVDENCATDFLQILGTQAHRPQVSAHNIMVFGDRAFMSYYQDGVRILDISDPTQPTEIAYYNTWEDGPGDSFFEGALGIDVDTANGLIYVADSVRELIVLRETITVPTDPASGGCGCTVTALSRRNWLGPLALALALLILQRRRRH